MSGTRDADDLPADIAGILQRVAGGEMSNEAALAWCCRELIALLRTLIKADAARRHAGGAASSAGRKEIEGIAGRTFVMAYRTTLEKSGASAAFRAAAATMKNIHQERSDRTYRRWLRKYSDTS